VEKPRVKHKLLDALMKELSAKDDATISRLMRWPQGYVSKVRHGHAPITANRILEIHDTLGWSVKRIKGLL
jgi:hypothetical protein